MVLKKLALLAVVLSLTACNEPTPEQVALAKQTTVSSFANPEVVGRLPDGRAVKRVIVQTPQQWDQNVYFVDDATVSNNYRETHGKVSVMRTQVSLPTNATPDDIIQAADALKKERDDAEEAEYQRLKKKRGHED